MKAQARLPELFQRLQLRLFARVNIGPHNTRRSPTSASARFAACGCATIVSTPADHRRFAYPFAKHPPNPNVITPPSANRLIHLLQIAGAWFHSLRQVTPKIRLGCKIELRRCSRVPDASLQPLPTDALWTNNLCELRKLKTVGSWRDNDSDFLRKWLCAGFLTPFLVHQLNQ